MDHKQLDDYFRTITDSERKYMAEGHNTFFDDLKTVVIDGPEKIEAKLLYNISNYIHHNRANSMYIKKNSRFCITPYHIHDWVEISYMYSGSCTQKINGNEYQQKKGQVVLIDRDTPHELSYMNENDILISIMIKPEYLNTNFFNRLSKENILTDFFIKALSNERLHHSYIIFPENSDTKLEFYMNELFCEMIEASPYNEDRIDSLFTLILCELIELYSVQKEVVYERNKETSMIAILRYIETNYADCSLESVARHFGLNTSYLSFLIKKKLNTSYIELIQKQRLKSAKTYLLNTDLSIVQIANTVGYDNMNFFYKKFKKLYGVTPSEYRKQNKNNE